MVYSYHTVAALTGTAVESCAGMIAELRSTRTAVGAALRLTRQKFTASLHTVPDIC